MAAAHCSAVAGSAALFKYQGIQALQVRVPAELNNVSSRHSQPVGPHCPGWDQSTSTRTPSQPHSFNVQ
eukprot:1894712-Rhodomonas_salina.1